jgi:hypothetical protein
MLKLQKMARLATNDGYNFLITKGVFILFIEDSEGSIHEYKADNIDELMGFMGY